MESILMETLSHPYRRSQLRGSHPASGLSAIALVAAACTFSQAALAESGPAEGCAKGSATKSFSERFSDTYTDYLKWDGDPADTPPSWRKDLQPPPVSGPPFPFANWPIGGTENIGYENMYYGALMDSIYCGPDGQAAKDSRFTVYGWIQPGLNISTSKSKYNFVNGTGGNYPAAYSYQPNTAQLDQVALYLERTPDEVQKNHMDWGFRLAGLYGTDYKYTFSRGLFSNQYTQDQKKIGFDIPMAYAELYLPQVAEGMNIRVGRYISVPDIEAQLAPNNYTYSHSLLYTYDPYTQEGVVGTVKLDKNWTVQGELSVGNDVAYWYKATDPTTGQKLGAQLTPAACLSWTSDSGGDNLYGCYNGFHPILGNKGNFGWNNLQHEVLTWYHKFDDKWHMSTEAWYMYQNNVPNVNPNNPNTNPAGASILSAQFPGLNIGAPFGAQCADPNAVTCRAEALAFVNYIEYQWSPRDFLTLRTDILNDRQGQRTGFAARYTEFLLGWTHWIGKAITIRPELRYERASVPAYDNPTGNIISGVGKRTQTMFAIDAIFHF